MVRRRAPGSLLVALLGLLGGLAPADPAAAQPRDDKPSLPIATDEPVTRPAPPTEPSSLPVPSEPAQPSDPPEPRTDGSGSTAVITFELGGQGAHVDVPGADLDGGGALGGHIFIVGYSSGLTYRLAGNGAVGGQTSGLLTRFSGNASIGPALALGLSARLFARIGMEATGHKDDELDTSLFTVPSGIAGLQLTSSNVLFEIGPRAGATLRSVYAPGNEAEGRRHSRRSRVAPAWGGTMVLVSNILLVEASLTRVEQSAGLWLAEATACPVGGGDSSVFVLCGTAQHWRGDVVGPLGNVAEVGSWVAGASIGFGFFKNRRRE